MREYPPFWRQLVCAGQQSLFRRLLIAIHYLFQSSSYLRGLRPEPGRQEEGPYYRSRQTDTQRVYLSVKMGSGRWRRSARIAVVGGDSNRAVREAGSAPFEVG